MTTHILALEKDLFFSVKMRDTLRHHGMEVKSVRSHWEVAIRRARTASLPVLAFGSHMDLEAREKAIQAGAQRVVANSKFTSDMPGLVKRMLNEPGAPAIDETASVHQDTTHSAISPRDEQ